MLDDARKLHKSSLSRERELSDSKIKLVAVECEWSKQKQSLIKDSPHSGKLRTLSADEPPHSLLYSRSLNDRNLHSIKEECPLD